MIRSSHVLSGPPEFSSAVHHGHSMTQVRNFVNTKMKKNSVVDYRRETAELIKIINLSDVDLAAKLQTNVRSVYRWRLGLTTPHRTFFEKLVDLAGLSQPTHSPPDTMTRVMGHIDQLTKQIAQLQGEVAVLRDRHDIRMMEMEKKIKELGGTVGTLEDGFRGLTARRA